MQLSKSIASILAITSLALVVGCGATAQKEGTGEFIDDSVITTKIKAALFNEPALKSMEINVETFKGRVQLSGFVTSPSNAATAVTLARGVTGVQAVKDDIRIK